MKIGGLFEDSWCRRLVNRIISEVLGLLPKSIPSVKRIKVTEVVIGLGYTGVMLTTGHVGLCYTFRNELPIECCQIVNKAGTLAGSGAMELASLAKSWDVTERMVGVATMNALSQIVFEKKADSYAVTKADMIEELEVRKGDTVVMVGLFHPFVPVLKKKAKKLIILEKNLVKQEGVLPDFAAEEYLPEADVAIITGSTFANGTLDSLLDLAKGAREIAITGPSVYVIPDPLFKRGVTLIGTYKPTDAKKTMTLIAEGGGTPQLPAAGKFVVIKPKEKTKKK